MREGEAASWHNPVEASALVALVQGLLAFKSPHGGKGRAVRVQDIGVIATYRQQARHLALLFRPINQSIQSITLIVLGAERGPTDCQSKCEGIVFYMRPHDLASHALYSLLVCLLSLSSCLTKACLASIPVPVQR